MEVADFSKLCNFTQKQKEALEAVKKYKYVLYGGSMGSGKSHWLRWMAIYWLLYLSLKYKAKGIRAGLFCEDYGSLNDRHISKIRMEFPKGLGTYNEQRHEFTLHPHFGSSTLAFRNLDDPSKYVSSEFALIAVDEISRNPYSMFSILRTRLRWVGIPEVRFISASNPVGEPWVKRYWIDRNFPPEEKESDQFAFVKALPTDNPHLTEDYFKGLESLSESERKAYLEGDWSAFETVMDAEGWMKLLTDVELQNAFVDTANHIGNGVLGVDPAAGGDRSAVVFKSETCQEVFFSQRLNDVLQLVPVIANAMEHYKVKQVVVDRTGIGDGLYQRLKELEFPVKGVSFQEKPTNSEKFYNIKAELYWREKEWILRGGKLLRHSGWNDFVNIKWKRYNDKVIRIQGKDELRQMGFNSPDVVDAACLSQFANKNLDFDQVYKSSKFRDKMLDIWRN